MGRSETISIYINLRKITLNSALLITIGSMNYPNDSWFDIETLINVAQPQSILLLGDCDAAFLQNYLQQRTLLELPCSVTQLRVNQIEDFNALQQKFDVAIAINWFEHFDKRRGEQVLARLRDVLCPQYCICLPLQSSSNSNNVDKSWQITDLFSFALSKVASYTVDNVEYGLFKYNINDYKKTPDWLNADNWANPQMWGKYWW